MSDNLYSIDDRMIIDQVSKWLKAWAIDQGYIASRQAAGSARATEFAARSQALSDAAGVILTTSIWDLAGFMDAKGRYPERQP